MIGRRRHRGQAERDARADRIVQSTLMAGAAGRAQHAALAYATPRHLYEAGVDRLADGLHAAATAYFAAAQARAALDAVQPVGDHEEGHTVSDFPTDVRVWRLEFHTGDLLDVWRLVEVDPPGLHRMWDLDVANPAHRDAEAQAYWQARNLIPTALVSWHPSTEGHWSDLADDTGWWHFTRTETN